MQTDLTHELLPVFVARRPDFVVGSQLFLSTPGVQEILDVRHSGELPAPRGLYLRASGVPWSLSVACKTQRWL